MHATIAAITGGMTGAGAIAGANGTMVAA